MARRDGMRRRIPVPDDNAVHDDAVVDLALSTDLAVAADRALFDCHLQRARIISHKYSSSH
jgi:hypothetical protein